MTMKISFSGTFDTLLLTIVLLGAAALAMASAFRALLRRITNAQPFGLLMLATAWWSFGYAMELNSGDLQGMLRWAKAEYLGIVSIPPLWLFFTARYTHDDEPVRWRRWLALALIPLITLLLVGTNEWHGLIWAATALRTDGDLHILETTHGPWFWVHTVYSYTLILTGSAILLRSVWHIGSIYRSQIFFLSAGALTPLLGNLLFIAGLSPLPDLDLTPLFFALTGLLFIWGDYRARLLSVVPI
ncbi:MAG: hypothetical protein HGA19_05940, partial [Oscillochloris sp.]|nr:hypothetical protein [Oscillochloris sp.]